MCGLILRIISSLLMTKSKATSASIAESTNTPWFGVTLCLLGIIIGYSAAQFTGDAKPTNTVPTQVADEPKAPVVGDFADVDKDSDWIRGNIDAPVTVIEWSDYECPFCSRHHPTLQALIDNNPDDVNWVYRHYPLSFHPNAQKAAEAAECAGEQGGNDAFWEFSDRLFTRGVERASYETYAQEIGLNVKEFTTCIDSGKYADEVAKDMADGSKAGVTGTPGSVMVNNKTGDAKLISGAQPVAAFEAALQELL
jgi:protein-disulfide isomerase